MADNIQFRVDAVLGDTSQLQTQINNLKTNLSLTIDNTRALSAIQDVQDRINALQKSANSINLNFGSGNNSGSNNSANINIPTVNQSALANIQQAQTEMANLGAESAKINMINGQITSSTYQMKDGYSTLNSTIKASGDQIDVLKVKSDELQQKLNWTKGDVVAKNVSGISDIKNTDWFKSLGEGAEIVGGVTRSLNAQSQQMEKTTVRVKTADNQWQKYNATLNNSTGELRVLKGQTSDVINSQMNLSNMLVSAIERFAVWGVAMKLWTGIGNAIQDCTSYITDLNKAMTDIQMVTMATESEIQNMSDTYNKMAQNLGRTTLDVAESAVDWLRQGYSTGDTELLIEDSMKLSTLGAMDSADATTALTSAMKGYQLQADEVIGVVDKLVTVDMQAATSAGDLATALSRCANIARTSGVDIDQALGMIAVTAEVTQQSAQTIGNAFKTIFSRMQNIKTGHLIDPETSEALNDVEITLSGMGIKLRENENTWRNFGDVLDEVAVKWDNFSETQKSALATAFAGTRQKEIFITLMENYENATKYAETASESFGTANEKYAVYMDNIEAKQNQLTASIQEFYSNILDSGFIAGLLSIGQALMSIMNIGDGLVGKLSLLTVGTVAWVAVLNLLKKSGITSFSALIAKILGVTVAEEGATAGAIGLKTVLDSLKAHPIILAISAITTALTIGVTAWNKYQESIQESIEKAQELTEEYKKTSEEFKNNMDSLTETTSLNSNGKQYKTLQDEFNKLCKGVDRYGNNLSLTNEEYNRYKSICEQIVGLNPDLMDGYNSEIEAIGNKNGLLQNTINLLKEKNRLEAKEYADKSDDVLKGAQNKYTKATSGAKDTLAQIEQYKSDNDTTKDYTNGQNAWYKIFGTTDNGGYNLNDIDYDGTFLTDSLKVAMDNWDEYEKKVDELKTKIEDSTSYKNLTDAQQDSIMSALDNYKTTVQGYIDETDECNQIIADAENELSGALDGIYQAVAQSIEGYSDLDTSSQNFINQFILDNYKTDDQTTEEAVNANKKAIQNIINGIKDGKNGQDAQKALRDLYTIDTDSINFDDLQKKIKEVAKKVSKATGQNQGAVELSLQANLDIDYTKLGKIESILSSKFYEPIDVVRGKIGNMSAESIQALLNLDDAVLQNCHSWDDLKVAMMGAKEVVDSDTVFSDYATDLQSLSEQYEILSKAQDEYNEYGNITASTMKKIIDNGLLDYLTVENGQLQFNTQALQNNATALQDNAIAKLQEALFTDLCSIANGTYQESLDSTDSSNANSELQTFRTELDKTAGQALTTAGAVSAVNSAMNTNYKFDTEEQKRQANAVVKNYNDMVAKIKSLSTNLSTGNYRSKGSSSSGGSSSSKKSAEENAFDSLKKKFEADDITINQYINGMQKILKKVKKGSDLYEEIQEELKKQKLDNAKNQFSRGEITIDQYIKKLTKLRKSYKKNTEGYKELAEEINKSKADKWADQYERGEISLNSYIKKLKSLRDSYVKNSEKWKEYNDLMNSTKADAYADKYERGEISADSYIKKLEKLRNTVKVGSKKYKEYTDLINETKLDKAEKYVDNLRKKIDKINDSISLLGNVNTDSERTKQAKLTSDKLNQVKSNQSAIKTKLDNDEAIHDDYDKAVKKREQLLKLQSKYKKGSKKYKEIQKEINAQDKIIKQLKGSYLTEEERVALQEEYNQLLIDEVDIRDEIEDAIRGYYENQKEQLEQQAELNRKQKLYNKELELYGEKGKDVFEWEANKKIEALEKEKELREAERDALDQVNEREEYENDLLEARLKLQNALNNKTTKILTKQDDGTWAYTFSANMSDVKSAQEEVKKAEDALSDYTFEQETQIIQDQIDELQKTIDDKATEYEDYEFWLDREYEATINGIEQAFGNIDELVQNWLATYGKTDAELTKNYQKLTESNNSLITSLNALTIAINGKYETVGVNSVTPKDGVTSFDTGGEIKGSGLAFVHNKERVLTQEQNTNFTKLLNNIDDISKLIDIAKVSIPNLNYSNGKINPQSGTQVVINGVTCNFPNITTPDGLQKAILGLPALAIQQSKVQHK